MTSHLQRTPRVTSGTPSLTFSYTLTSSSSSSSAPLAAGGWCAVDEVAEHQRGAAGARGGRTPTPRELRSRSALKQLKRSAMTDSDSTGHLHAGTGSIDPGTRPERGLARSAAFRTMLE
ncbi:hypothetical protein NDU88_000820 [Pleurodeles waltl]|uniref:Uncharacterized protein n=1 Tax=Pleurodeles waltl TaxID=8319 RepID=A0AAV7LVT1_PLEWA|nr:hypothetical protein NDU88_000820 [Pleurodeles waltl]